MLTYQLMRVLMLNYEFPPLGGGTAVANRYLLHQFKKQRNLKIDLVTSSTNKYKKEVFSSNINIFRLNIGKNNKNLHHQSSKDLLNYLIKLTAWVKKHQHNYDLIHAFSGLPGGITALLSGKPYIISLRGTDVPGYEERFSWLAQLIRPLIRLSWKQARLVDTNSQYLKDLALKTAPELRIKVILNGVDNQSFYPAKKMPKKMVILCNSRLGKRKGIEYLIKAMPEVLAKVPQTRLILVGEGVEKEKLKRLTQSLKIAKKVRFLSKVKHGKLPSIYRNASLFVLPSLSESLSNSLLEALACGLPVVATKVGGNSELVTKKNGVLTPPTNSQTLAEGIIRLLSKPGLRKNMGKANRQMVKQFDWKKTAGKYFEIYCRLVN